MGVWSRDTSFPTPVANLNSVKCVNSNDCWAVGGTAAGLPNFVHWDGTGWTNFAVSATIFPKGILRDIGITGPSYSPMSAWQEVFA